jgi:ComF family protein
MKNIIDYILPKHCLLCNLPSHSGIELCNDCIDNLPKNLKACHYCGIPSQTNSHCISCNSYKTPFKRTLAPYLYDAGIKHLIGALKFRQNLVTAELLANLFISETMQSNISADYLLPVPAHKHRLKERGFNQAHEISKALAKKLNIPILTAIQKKKHTTPQSLLSAKQRQTNLKNAFSLTGSIPISRIAIIDDVITTGSTMNEIAHLLQETGVSHIEAWAIARTE